MMLFSPGRLWAMIRKEFIQLRRDRLTFAMMIGIPLLRPYAWLAFASMFVAIAAAMLVQGFLGRQVVRDGGTV